MVLTSMALGIGQNGMKEGHRKSIQYYRDRDAVFNSGINAPALGFTCSHPCAVLHAWAFKRLSKSCTHMYA